MSRKVSLSITLILILMVQKPVASFFDRRTHIIPWTSLPGIAVPYRIWSSVQKFSVNDKIVFVFPQGFHTAAEVTKEGYDKCNLTEIISIEAASPATFNIDSVGKHYYICTVAGHCQMGQKVAVTVPDSPPALVANSAPLLSSARDVSGEAVTTHMVGDEFGWAPSSGGASDYKAWASNRTFLVGDTLVFKFVNKLHDVALVPKSAYENCDTSHGSGVVGMLAGAAASYGANHMAHGHGHGHGGYAHGGYGGHGGYYGHKHGKFKHGKFGKHGKFKKWK